MRIFRMKLHTNCTGMGARLRKMKKTCRFLKSSVLAMLACTVLLLTFHNGPIFDTYTKIVEESNGSELNTVSTEDDEIILAHAVCGQKKFRETLTMLKSAIMFQKSSKIHFIIFTDILQEEIKKSFDNWKPLTNNTFSYEFPPVQYPGVNENDWIYLWGKCATLRIFFPTLLPQVKKVLYVDSDILFMNDLSEIWRIFRVMNSTQLCAATYDMQDKKNNYYKTRNEIPYYGDGGINSGVLLMDLERMRHFDWVNKSIDTFTKYRPLLKCHDQDLLNIIFNFHPERMYLLPCFYSVKKHDCERIRGMCRDAVSHGISLLHGQDYVYTSPAVTENDKYYSFRLIYQAYENYQLGTDPVENLWKPLKRELNKLKDEDCTAIMNVYLERTKGISSIP